jgi:hypothetical protein
MLTAQLPRNLCFAAQRPTARLSWANTPQRARMLPQPRACTRRATLTKCLQQVGELWVCALFHNPVSLLEKACIMGAEGLVAVCSLWGAWVCSTRALFASLDHACRWEVEYERTVFLSLPCAHTQCCACGVPRKAGVVQERQGTLGCCGRGGRGGLCALTMSVW